MGICRTAWPLRAPVFRKARNLTCGGEMVLPATNNDVLEALHQRKRQCAARIYAALSRGDIREARPLQLRMKEIDALILESGGEPEA